MTTNSTFTVRQAVQLARDGGYERVMLLDTTKGILMTEYFLSAENQWKNRTIAPFVIEEFADQQVEQTLQHPTQPDTFMIFTPFDQARQWRAANKCRDQIKANRKSRVADCH